MEFLSLYLLFVSMAAVIVTVVAVPVGRPPILQLLISVYLRRQGHNRHPFAVSRQLGHFSTS